MDNLDFFFYLSLLFSAGFFVAAGIFLFENGTLFEPRSSILGLLFFLSGITAVGLYQERGIRDKFVACEATHLPNRIRIGMQNNAYYLKDEQNRYLVNGKNGGVEWNVDKSILFFTDSCAAKRTYASNFILNE